MTDEELDKLADLVVKKLTGAGWGWSPWPNENKQHPYVPPTLPDPWPGYPYGPFRYSSSPIYGAR